MIDFNELSVDGTDFELLIREILICENMDVHWTGVGPDGGKDLIAIENVDGIIQNIARKWVVQCKHNSHSKKSVGANDLQIVDTCGSVNAKSYLLACSTQPSNSLITKFKDLENKEIIATYWDSIEIEKRLLKPNCFHLINIFFPKSSQSIGWQIYKTNSTYWIANYKSYLIYLSSRTAHDFPNLNYIELIIDIMESFPKIDSRNLKGIQAWIHKCEYLKPRAIFFDNKNTNFHVYIDYIVDSEASPEITGIEFEEFFNQNNCNVEGVGVVWSIFLVQTSLSSDHFDFNHTKYYQPYIHDFLNGEERGAYNMLDCNYYENTPEVKAILQFFDKIDKTKVSTIQDNPYDFNELVMTIIQDNFGRITYTKLLKVIFEKYGSLYYGNDSTHLPYLWQIYVCNAIQSLRDQDVLKDFNQTPNSVIELTSV